MTIHRYSIMARPYGADHEIEIAQCDTNPEAVVEAVREKFLKIDGGNRKVLVAKYEHVHVVDRGE